MQRENLKRILRNVAVVAGIIVVLLVLFFIVRSLFVGGGAPQKSQLTDPLIDTSTDRGVQMVIRGPIEGDETARSYEIDVSPSSRSVTLYQGYEGTVLDKKVYSNSPQAYEQFVYALDADNMTGSRTITNDDTRGVCATGRLYTFSLVRDGDVDSSLWAASCSGINGTLTAKVEPLRDLFDAQIPDIGDFNSDLY